MSVTTYAAVGGESAPPSYEYLRGRLELFFLYAGAMSLTAQVEKNGENWHVASGVVNDPRRVWHESGITYRTVATETGPWYEAEVQNASGRPVIGFAFAPEGGYKVLEYDAADGLRGCMDNASEGHIALMTEMIDRTILDAGASERAGLDFTMAVPDPELL